MLLKGGVAGGVPPHKGGRLRPTARNCSGQGPQPKGMTAVDDGR